MNIRDLAERLVWTVVAAFGGGLVGSGIDWPISLDAWDAARLAALTAGINFVLIVARQRLAVLPDPGQGLPGLPVE